MPCSNEVSTAASTVTRSTPSGTSGSSKVPSSSRLLNKTKARAVEPDDLAQPPPAVEEEVEVTVHGIEPHSSHRPGERVEAAPHVDGLDAHEDAHPGAKAQHDATTRSSRSSVASSKRSSSSIASVPASDHVAPPAPLSPPMSSPPARPASQAVVAPAARVRRPRLTRQAFSDRPSIPCSRAHLPAARTTGRLHCCQARSRICRVSESSVQPSRPPWRPRQSRGRPSRGPRASLMGHAAGRNLDTQIQTHVRLALQAPLP